VVVAAVLLAQRLEEGQRMTERGTWLTPEKERNLRREHERLHPEAMTPGGRFCDVCVLLARLSWERRNGLTAE
jgi:hypothetical protein